MQAWTTPPNVGLRGPLAPGPAVVERRASDDVLPSGVAAPGTTTWVAALVASVARTAWLAAVLTLVFLGGFFAATVARGGSFTAAAPWAGIGGGFWLLLTLTWTLLRRDR